MITSFYGSPQQSRLDYHDHQNLLSCDGLLPLRVNGAYWKLSSTGGSVGFGGVTPHTERWVSQIPHAITKPEIYIDGLDLIATDFAVSY